MAEETGVVKADTKGISPKLVFAVVGAICAYLLTQEIVDLPGYVDLLLNVVLVGGGAAAASPGLVKVKNPFVEDGTPADGHSHGG